MTVDDRATVSHRSRRAVRTRSRRTVRIVSGLLAVIWLAAGFAAIVVAVNTARWLPAIVGVVALWYGLLWVRVFGSGRQLTAREALMPWRIRSHSDG